MILFMVAAEQPFDLNIIVCNLNKGGSQNE